MFKKYIGKKKFLIFSGLAVFGALILAFVLWGILKEESPHLQLSVEQSKTRISKKCKKWIDKLVTDTQEVEEYKCTVRTRKSYEGASYTVKSKILIKREEAGKGIKVEMMGSLKNPTRHATEANFCSDNCAIQTEEINKGSNTMEVIGAIVEMTNSLEENVKEAVREAKAEYDKEKQRERMGKQKERGCLGKWDKTDKYFEDFSIEQQIDCKFTKLHSIKDPERREWYYQHVLKKDLWKLAVGEEDSDFLRPGLLDAAVDPYYSGATKSSMELLSLYLDWKKDYGVLDTVPERERFGGRIKREALNIVSRLHPDYVSSDVDLLNNGLKTNFEEAFARIRAIPSPSAASTYNKGSPSTVDYQKASESVDSLW